MTLLATLMKTRQETLERMQAAAEGLAALDHMVGRVTDATRPGVQEAILQTERGRWVFDLLSKASPEDWTILLPRKDQEHD